MEQIIELLKKAWDFIKKIKVKLFSFTNNIINFFKAKIATLRKTRPDTKAIAVKIKKQFENGEYNTIDVGLDEETVVANVFYDLDKEEIIEGFSEIVRAEKLDEETIRNFGDKEMIVLK